MNGGGYVRGTPEHPGLIQESTLDNLIEFENNSFISYAPFSNLELEKLNSAPGAITADIRTHYSPNFSFDSYIAAISSDDVKEYHLPNMYSFLFLTEKEGNPSSFTNESEKIVHNLTLLNSMQMAENHKGEKIFPQIDLKDALQTIDKENYYNVYSYVLSKLLGDIDNPDGVSQQTLGKGKAYYNIAFSDSTTDLLREFTEFRSAFPMTTEISFATDKDIELSSMLNESFLMPSIIEKVIEFTDENIPATTKENTLGGLALKGYVEYSDLYTIEESPNYDSTLDKEQVFQETIRKTWDLEEIINSYTNIGDDYINENSKDHSVFYSTDELDFNDPSSSIVKTILLAAFKNKMQNYIADRTRTLEELMNGEYSDAEIVLYRIEKLRLNEQTQDYDIVQNIYVPNSNKLNITTILDSQVKYGVVYKYKIYAYYAVVGAKYSYWNVFAGAANLPQIDEPVLQPPPPPKPDICEDFHSLIQSGVSVDGEPIFSSVGSLAEGACGDLATQYPSTTPGAATLPPGSTIIELAPVLAGGLPVPEGKPGNPSVPPPSGLTVGPPSTNAPGGPPQSGMPVVDGSAKGFGTLGPSGQEEFVHPVLGPKTDKNTVPAYPDAYLSLKFDILVKPTLKLIEVPHFNTNPGGISMILDNPPLPPQVDVIPTRAVKNKIRFLFDESVGQQTVMPIAIESTDEEYFKVQRLAQSVGETDPIKFSADNPLSSFQIYRVTQPPINYSDFEGARILTTSNTSYEDTIQANKKYYYMFRSVDDRGNFSNPSPVYQLEMVTLEDGSDSYKTAVLPNLKIYELPKSKKDNFTRDMRKYILIRPSRAQSILNESESRLPGSEENPTVNLDNIEPKLGKTDKALFNKQDISGSLENNRKFKMRITSKKTGRRIEFNFQFKHKHNKPNLNY